MYVPYCSAVQWDIPRSTCSSPQALICIVQRALVYIYSILQKKSRWYWIIMVPMATHLVSNSRCIFLLVYWMAMHKLSFEYNEIRSRASQMCRHICMCVHTLCGTHWLRLSHARQLVLCYIRGHTHTHTVIFSHGHALLASAGRWHTVTVAVANICCCRLALNWKNLPYNSKVN